MGKPRKKGKRKKRTPDYLSQHTSVPFLIFAPFYPICPRDHFQTASGKEIPPPPPSLTYHLVCGPGLGKEWKIFQPLPLCAKYDPFNLVWPGEPGLDVVSAADSDKLGVVGSFIEKSFGGVRWELSALL